MPCSTSLSITIESPKVGTIVDLTHGRGGTVSNT